MYRRRQVLLMFIQQASPRQVDAARLHQWMFAFCQQHHDNIYDFVVLDARPHSFLLQYDLIRLKDTGHLQDDWVVTTDEIDLQDDDLAMIQAILQQDHLPTLTLEREPHDAPPVLFTLGYEGISVDAYLARLIRHDVQLLVDVRNNPNSRKYGFSKKQLAACLDALGLAYHHLPQLGVPKALRPADQSEAAYEVFFETYERDILPNATAELDALRLFIDEHQRVAITCYEADHNFCHRSRVAAKLASEYTVRHI